MQLIINHHPATLPADQQIKLRRENPFFTDAGDYTLDITLPLADCPENQRCIGPLHRPETSPEHLAHTLLPFTLSCPPIHLTGTCRITAIDAQEAKVQLLAGRTALNNALPEDTHIDQLDLGRIWSEHTYDPARHGQLDVNPANDGTFATCRDIYQYVATLQRLNTTEAQAEAQRILYGRWGETSACAFPIHSTTTERTANLITLSTDTTQQNPNAQPLLPLAPDGEGNLTWPFILAPQPYLIEIIRRILNASGYTLNITDTLSQSALAQIIITNPRPTLNPAHILPHWTLREFITEVQNFAACVFIVDNENNVSILHRGEWYNQAAPIVHLTETLTPHQLDIDTTADTLQATAGNIDYDHPTTNPQLRLPDEAWQRADVRTFNTAAELSSFMRTLTTEDKEQSRHILTIRGSNTYAFLRNHSTGKYAQTQVDIFPPIIRRNDTRDIDTLLHIVPCRQTFGPIPPITYQKDGNTTTVSPHADYPYLTTETPTTDLATGYSVDKAINPDNDNTETTTDNETPKRIEVAFWNGNTKYYHTTPQGTSTPIACPDATPYDNNPTTGLLKNVSISGTIANLSLHPAKTLGAIHAAAPTINTNITLTLQFITHTPPPTNAVFHYRGRRYACQKLEITLCTDGMHPRITGTFHPLDQ